VPDNQDYADLADLLSRPTEWSEADAELARTLRESQAQAAAAFDQRDKSRVGSMWNVVRQLDEALSIWEAGQ
jgi:hypothetical protein